MSGHCNWDGVCFDMDGVLVQSERFWVERHRDHILPKTAPDDEIPVSAVTGRSFRDVYDDLAAEYDVELSRAEFESLFERAGERIYGEQAHLTPGATDLLADLSAAGVPLALVTSSPREWIALLDERVGLTAHFDAVVSADDLDGPGKPAPGIYERGAAELGVPPAACVAVEDSTAGLEAATAAGMDTIGFRGDGDEADLTGADVVVTGTDELRAVLLSD